MPLNTQGDEYEICMHIMGFRPLRKGRGRRKGEEIGRLLRLYEGKEGFVWGRGFFKFL